MRERVRIIGALIVFMCMIVPSIGMAGSVHEETYESPIPETPLDLTGYKICVDPGHGGSDPGTTGINGPGYPDEKDHTLDIGLRLQTLLAGAGATVIMTRTTDISLTLQDRCDIANDNSTDIFISIHCNAVGTESVMGTETFYWGVDAVTYSVNGKRLAEDVQAEEVAILGSNDRGAKMDFPYFGYHLYVLANTAMPAILTEVGFMSNQTEFDLLATPEYRQDAAQGIANGVYSYFGVDPDPPVSHVNDIPFNWAEWSPYDITATASDALGYVEDVELWWRSDFTPTWTLYGTDTAEPWLWSFDFEALDGEGINYEFYSIAIDNSSNREDAPPVCDTWCLFAWSHYLAEALGPVGSSSSLGPFTITYKPNCGCFGINDIYFSNDNNNTWNLIGPDADGDGFYSWTAPVSGTYWWIVNGDDYFGPGTNWPFPGEDAHAGPYIIDLNPFIQSSNPADSSTGVPIVLGSVTIEFSEPMSMASSGYTSNLPGGFGMWMTPTTFVIDGIPPLNLFTSYWIDLSGQGHQDMTGNPLSGDMLIEFDTAFADPLTTINSMTPTYVGQLPDEATLTVTGDDTMTGGSNVIAAEYRVDGGSWIPMIPGPIGVITTFTATVDLHNWTLGDHNINARCSDGTWDATPDWLVYNIADTTEPEITYIAPTPPDGATVAVGTTIDVQVEVEDFLDISLSGGALIYYRDKFNATFDGPYAMNYEVWDEGSNIVTYSYSITRNYKYIVEYYVEAWDGNGNWNMTPVREIRFLWAPNAILEEISPYNQTNNPLTINTTVPPDEEYINVTLWYRYSTDNSNWDGWTAFEEDTAEPWSWEFTWPNGTGYYEFFAYAIDIFGYGEAFFPPLLPEALAHFGTYSLPESSVDTIFPYWSNSIPRQITASASNSSSVNLWYRYSNDNSSWGSWIDFGEDLTAPWSWDYDWPQGEGYYEFFSIGTNISEGTTEPMKTTAEASCGHDTSAPYNGLFIPPGYWRNENPYTINSPLVDELSGMAPMQDMWFDYSMDGFTWFGYMLYGSSVTGSWNFNWPMGMGHYRFIFDGSDIAGNNRGLPMFEDMALGFDNQAPGSWIDPIDPVQIGPTVLLDATAVDNGPSGINSVECWWSFEGGPWTTFGTDPSPPYEWIFNFPNGAGYYEFVSTAGDNAGNWESLPAGNDTWCFLPILPEVPDQVNDLLATGHQPTADDIQLEWSEVPDATSYNIYRSTSVRGTGFNFAAPYDIVPSTGGAKIIYVDTGAYADSSNYSWIVRSVNANGENETDLDNIAFKLRYEIKIGAGSVTPDLNYISLPFRLNITSGVNINNAAALRDDMRTYGNPPDSITSASRWNSDTGLWEVKTAFGTNFDLTPGEAYRIVPTAPSVWYSIVGSHDESVNIYDIMTGAGAITPDLNYIALPYHVNLADAAALRNDIRANGTPVNSVNAIGRWNSDAGLWEVKTAFGTNFALTPGEAYRIVPIVASVTWTCPVATPGP